MAKGFQISADTVARLLKAMDYRLHAPVKALEGAQDPDRDAQFVYLNGQAADHPGGGQPVISVDTFSR